MTTRTFTVEEFLQAAEQNKYPNFNETFISYNNKDYWEKETGDAKPVYACVIGEAFLNLGMVENGIDAAMLSNELRQFTPDIPLPKIIDHEASWHDDTIYYDLDNMSDVINTLNGLKGYQGKKKIAKLVRKHFPNSLDKKITLTPESRYKNVW